MSTPEVSVIIPAYNAEPFLAQAIESVLAQSFTHYEVVIVDDGSTDSTRGIVRQYKDLRIQYIYQENRGLPSARNSGIRNSRGKYLCFLDADDVLKPRKLQLQVDYLDAHPEYAVVFSHWSVCNDSGVIFDEFEYDSEGDLLKELLQGNRFPVHAALTRRDAVEAVGLFDETLRGAEDWDLWLRLANSGFLFGKVDQTLVVYRLHTGSMSTDTKRMEESLFAVLDKAFSQNLGPLQQSTFRNQAYARIYTALAWRYIEQRQLLHGRRCLAEAARLGLDLKIVVDSGIYYARRLARRKSSGSGKRFLLHVIDQLERGQEIPASTRNRIFGSYYGRIAVDLFKEQQFVSGLIFGLRSFGYDPVRYFDRILRKEVPAPSSTEDGDRSTSV